jgi:hypothetical protein
LPPSLVKQRGVRKLVFSFRVLVTESDYPSTEVVQPTSHVGHRATPTTSDDFKNEAAQPHIINIITRNVNVLVNRCLRTICTTQINVYMW